MHARTHTHTHTRTRTHTYHIHVATYHLQAQNYNLHLETYNANVKSTVITLSCYSQDYKVQGKYKSHVKTKVCVIISSVEFRVNPYKSLYGVVTALLSKLLQPCGNLVTTLSPHGDNLGIETVTRL